LFWPNLRRTERAREYFEMALQHGNLYEPSLEYSEWDYSVCVLSGVKMEEPSDIVCDHFIVFSKGHLGAISGNIIPLRYDLNMLKLDSNPFEWGSLALSKGLIKEELWNRTIERLANKLALELEEYR
jgi:hypothetical protein